VIGKTVVQFQIHSSYRLLLPEEEFEGLFGLLVSDFDLICALSSISASPNFDGDFRKLALSSTKFYRSCRMGTAFCIALLDSELTKNLDSSSLWRGNTFFTAVIEAFIR
jgi:hypothetical protein